MKKNYYLSEGNILGGHYEVVKVLGEDEFEILYLVKDTHRLESLFVIKEFFLKAYAQREDKEVTVMAKSKFLFEETKKEMISEIVTAQKNNENSQIKTYGYLEENNTIYTIMELINDSNMEGYFQAGEHKKKEIKDEIVLPPIQEHTRVKNKVEEIEVETPIVEKKQEKKSYLFLQILLFFVILLLGMAYYSWNMIKEEKERVKEKQRSQVSVVKERTVHTPPLEDREKEEEPENKEEDKEKEESSTTEEVPVVENQDESFDASYIEDLEPDDTGVDLAEIPKDEIYVNEEIKVDVTEEPVVQETLPVEEEPIVEEPTISLGTLISGKNYTDRFNRTSVKRFLDKFMLSSTHASIGEIVSQYDVHVDRYFSLKNVNHNTIRKDKVRYQKKWTKRNFRLVSFKIISLYRKGSFDYCDLSTVTQWNVSTDNLKTANGQSNGRMTLKRTNNGFKVTSVYTVK